MDTKAPAIRDLRQILNELEKLVQSHRSAQGSEPLTIKDFRRIFDQESAKMNQAIFNDQHDQVREACLRAVLPLLEILART